MVEDKLCDLGRLPAPSLSGENKHLNKTFQGRYFIQSLRREQEPKPNISGTILYPVSPERTNTYTQHFRDDTYPVSTGSIKPR